METLLLGLMIVVLTGMIVMNILLYLNASSVSDLAHLGDQPPSAWPTVSVIVPACDEEETIGEAMRSLGALDYPHLEIIAVNDRSQDRTGMILDELAMSLPNLRIIHLTELPEGWLGKLNAMQVGTEQATGEYLIYMDADVHAAPDTLRRCMSWVVEKKLDQATLIPVIKTPTFTLSVMVAYFAAIFMIGARVRRVVSGKDDAYVGVGAFNLVRRSLFEKTEGWEWLRMEVADDIGLAYLMHRHGARGGCALAADHLSLTWYCSAYAMIKGLEKNSYGALGQYNPLRTLVIALGLPLAYIALVFSIFTPFWWLGLVWIAGNAFNACVISNMGLPRISLFISSLAGFLVNFALIRSMVITHRNGGVQWRSTFYPLAALKKGQRGVI